MDRYEEKLDKITEQISEINITLARNTVSLEEHIKRTNILENKLEPVEKHVVMVNGVIKFLLGLAALSALFKLLN
jgi:hypothetical protein